MSFRSHAPLALLLVPFVPALASAQSQAPAGQAPAAPTQARYAGTFHAAVGQWTRPNASAARGVGPDIIYVTTAPSGYFSTLGSPSGFGAGGTILDEGGLPGTTNGTPFAGMPDRDSYLVNSFQLGYCDLGPAGGSAWEISFYAAYVPATSDRTPEATVNVSGLPAGGGCWIIDIDLTGGEEFNLAADGGAAAPGWDHDPNMDSFGWGFASSPVLFEDRVLIQCDVKGGGFAAALSAETGEELWRAERDELPSWGTPIVYDAPEGPEVAMNATNAVRGYDPTSGEVLWEIRGNSKITVASCVAADGLVVATGGYQRPAPIYVVRAGAFGDLTPGEAPEGSLAWSAQRDGAYQPTPLLYDGLLYVFHSNGILSCYVAETGERIYRERIGGGVAAYTASPIAADGYLYLTGEAGDVHVVRAGREPEVVAVNDVGGSTLATPAISNGVFLIRTLDELLAVAHR